MVVMTSPTPADERPPVPPFTHDSAVVKVRKAEDAWNTRDPQRVSMAYSPTATGVIGPNSSSVAMPSWDS